MPDEFVILVADRNRNVRDFLKRELSAENYRVQVAKDGREVLTMIDSYAPDLLTLDLELPYMDGISLLESIKEKKPSLPILIHSFLSDPLNHHSLQPLVAGFVEKSENTDRLKAAIVEVLKAFYPHRFDSDAGQVEDSEKNSGEVA